MKKYNEIQKAIESLNKLSREISNNVFNLSSVLTCQENVKLLGEVYIRVFNQLQDVQQMYDHFYKIHRDNQNEHTN